MDGWKQPGTPGSPPPMIRYFLSQIWCSSGKHRGLIIARPPYAPSCCCFIGIFSRRGFNKPLYLFVTTQAPLALTAAFFNFLTGYLLEGTGRGGGAGNGLVASVFAAHWATLCVKRTEGRLTLLRCLFLPFLFVWLWRSLSRCHGTPL